jgi:TonB family protein
MDLTKSIFHLFLGSIITLGITSCATTDGTLVESNRGKITVSDLSVEESGLTPGTFRSGVEQLFIEYPERCYDLRIDGLVRIYIDFEENGDIWESYVMRGIGGGCDEAAIRAIRNAEYTPAIDHEGNPVAARHWVTITFER